MLLTTSLLLLLSLALTAPSHAIENCNLTGSWINDLGSNMTIGAVNSEGEFDGIYNTTVTASKEEIKPSLLKGFQHTNTTNTTFGFTVKWNFTETTTVFTGQCFVDKDGKELLMTMWLLRSNVSINDNWKATLVGTNNFTRLHKRW